jgi:hypothetical protein
MFVGYCNIKSIYTNACGAAIVKPTPTKALPNTLPGTRPDTLPRALRKIGPGHLRLPSPFPAIRPRNAASVMTKMALEAVLGNLKLARRSRVTNGSSPHLVDYRQISTIGCHVYACRPTVMVPASAKACGEAGFTSISRMARSCCWPGRCCSRGTRFHTFATGKR